jgi:hypothetical protein
MSLEKDIWRSAALEAAAQNMKVAKTGRQGSLTSMIVHPISFCGDAEFGCTGNSFLGGESDRS